VTSSKKTLATKAPRNWRFTRPFFVRLRVLVAWWHDRLVHLSTTLAQNPRSIVIFFLNSALLSSPLGWYASAVINNNKGRMKSHEKGELS
jgi:hypothetical protein